MAAIVLCWLHADAPGEMNKAPQPSAPLPPPSPGLSQPGYPPAPPVVFGAQPPQMNPATQTRQPYYTSRPTLPPNSGRIPQSSAPQPIPPPHGPRPPHVFQPSPTQMMMIPQQPISFTNSQGAAYYIPGQYRPSYVSPQQYQVSSSPGFYPGTSPADYAGAYYSPQPQFTPPVAPAPVIISAAPQQQQAPPPPQQQAPPRRERKQNSDSTWLQVSTPLSPSLPLSLSLTLFKLVGVPHSFDLNRAEFMLVPQDEPGLAERKIRIRDPNQGGRDITEEIMSGGRSGSTPTPPQANGDSIPSTVTMMTRAEFPIPPGESPLPDIPPTPPLSSPISDVVDAPPPAPLDTSHMTQAVMDLPQFYSSEAPSTTRKEAIPPVYTTKPEIPLESPIAQPEELQLYNGVPLGSAHRDVSPIAEPDVTKEAPPVAMETCRRTLKEVVIKEVPAPVVKEPVLPAIKEMPAHAKETPAPSVVKETPAPSVVKETPSPSVVKETPSPSVVKETPAPSVVKETPAPSVVEETLTPVDVEIPVSTVKEITAPVTRDIPSTIVKTTVSVVAKETPSLEEKGVRETLVAKDLPSKLDTEITTTVFLEKHVVRDALSKQSLETPSSVVKETHIIKESPLKPTIEPSPTVVREMQVVKENPSKPAIEVLPGDVRESSVVKVPIKSPVVKEAPLPVAKEIQEAPIKEAIPSLEVRPQVSKATPPPAEKKVDAPSVQDTPTAQATPTESTMQAVSVPKKKRKMKELNKKETGDLLDAFKEPAPPEPEITPTVKAEPEIPVAVAPPPAEDLEETWEEKEDKLDAENIKPQSPSPSSPTEQKYQYKEDQWKPLNPEEKKKYDREFLLGFQFISASMSKPEGLPHISDVVLEKGQRGKEPRKIIASVSLTEDVQLNKAEKAWKPSVKHKVVGGRSDEDENPEFIRTQELFKRVRSVLNKLTPQMFQPLMKQVTELTIDTEERLKGVIDLIFEKAISEPNFSVAYANMCRCLMGLKVPISDKPTGMVNFRKLLLNRCQKEFEKDKDDDETFEKKQKELDEASGEEERQRLKEELEDAKDKARRRSLGNIKFIGELFKLKMLTENIMHDCIVKLLKNHDEESLECLCRLLATIGKDLDFQKAKPRMDQYFTQMEKIIKEKKTSSRIRFMLQDVIDLRRNSWVPRRGDQGPKTIEQIHRDAELEEHREQAKIQQQLLLSKKDSPRPPVGGLPGGSGVMGSRGTPLIPGGHPSRGNQSPEDGWNTVPISSKNRPIDTSRLSKITKPGALDFNNQLLAPGGKGTWGSWGKGSSGGTGAKPSESAPEPSRANPPNRFSPLQQPPSASSLSSNVDSDRRLPQRNSSSRERSDRFDRFERRDDRGSDRLDRNRPAVAKGSFSRDKEERNRETEKERSQGREKEEKSRERDQRPAEIIRRVSSMTDERDRDRERGHEAVKREAVFTPPTVPSKHALSEEELEKKSIAIIEEYLHINDLKEALQCVSELNSSALLSIFVRTGVESTLDRSTLVREHLGLLFHQLIKMHTLPVPQYYKGLMEVLEVADDMEIDVPHIWQYLAELISPVMQEGGIDMGPLFREVSKPLVNLGKAGVLLVEILKLLCKGMSQKKLGSLWREAGLSWAEFLPEDQDINKFVTEKGVEFTLSEDCVMTSGKSSLSPDALSRELERLLQEKADNQRILDWIEANLDEQQTSSNTFVRALMTVVCQSAIVSVHNSYRVDPQTLSGRASLLQPFIQDEQKELQALFALQSLMLKMEQPPNLLRMFFDALYDEDMIKEDTFYRWESSKDPSEQQGKGVALKSVTAFFTWLRQPEDESDNS
ncbi:hypothetical protein DNTS_023800 [Danionella cerebrum]|uniref:Eukaryotic translation initiation factor 4 gamma 1 n=1 Tax=Danionella cerebrum TaxID=2873325 RepID=A0A553QQI5_9TELE|nr:hypothetical protein DNTS_023800 [Danionella translucida]